MSASHSKTEGQGWPLKLNEILPSSPGRTRNSPRSAGAGGSLRYWFGETKYLAPPSYWELTLQYRFRIAGDKRAEGIFAQTSINY